MALVSQQPEVHILSNSHGTSVGMMNVYNVGGHMVALSTEECASPTLKDSAKTIILIENSAMHS